MAGEEVDGLHRMVRLITNASSVHEIKRIADAVCQFAVTLCLRRRGETKRPRVHFVQVSITACRECAQKVQRCSGLRVSLQHTVWIGNASLRREVETVDDVATVARQFRAIDHFGRCRTRLCHLASHTANFNDGNFGAVGQNHCHLQHHLKGVTDVISRKFSKALSAVTTLKKEGLAT